MSQNGWTDHTRPGRLRLHRTPEEANNCTFCKEDKHFSLLPPYPGERVRQSPKAVQQPLQQFEDEDAAKWSDSPAPSASPADSQVYNVRNRTQQTSPPLSPMRVLQSVEIPIHEVAASSSISPAPPQGFPTPLSQEQQSNRASPNASPTPWTPTGNMPNRLLSRTTAAQSTTGTSISFVAETPIPGLLASAALPGPPRQTIEVDHDQDYRLGFAHCLPCPDSPPSPFSASSGSGGTTPRTQEINHLRMENEEMVHALDDLVENTRDKTFRLRNLVTRNQILEATREHDRRMHDDRYRARELELRQVQEQLQAVEKARKKKWTTRLCGLVAWAVVGFVLALLCWVFWWNKTEYSYVEGRRRAFYGLG